VLVRVVGALLAIGVAVCGALLAIEVAWSWAQKGDATLFVAWPRWRAWLEGQSWNSTAVRVTAGILAATGLVLVIIAATARRRDILLQDPATEVSVTTSPASLARIVGQRVRAEDNVSGASVIATATRVRVRASSRLSSEEELRPRLLAVVKATVDGLPLVTTPRITVVVNSPRDRR